MIDYKKFARSTKAYYCGPEGFAAFITLYKERFAGKSYFIAADENTMAAAGTKLDKALTKAGLTRAGEYIYPGSPVLEADYARSLPLKKALEEYPGSCPIAVGSGTLNDLVKVACGELNRPYAVFATAASVDGYASDGAALVKDGFKQTIRCPAPELIVADREVLQSAPKDMTAAGYADLIAKIPAGADWLIADILGEDPIDKDVWDFIQLPLRDWTKLPLDMDKLYEGLTATGFAMQYIKQSRPASGAEHLISHIWEMEHLTYKGRSFSHGFKVGVGTVLSTSLMEQIFSHYAQEIDWKRALNSYKSAEDRITFARTLFEGTQLSQIIDVIKIKTPSPKEHEVRLELIREKWEELRKTVGKQNMSSSDIKNRLVKMGAPHEPADLGISSEKVLLTLKKAQLIRDRYTILDLVDDLGWWERVVL
jgi:glycerol-1-phosphate dehydrogenase [NAD(P)+]